MTYQVELRPAALHDFKRLSLKFNDAFALRWIRLASNPRPPDVEKLVAQVNRYRIRVGDYRIVYEIRDAVLLIMVF